MQNRITVLLLFFVLVSNVWSANPKIFNVQDFGAKGDGVVDDYAAITKCAVEAVKVPNSIIRIPFGSYRISKTITIDFLTQIVSVEGVLNKQGLAPTLFTDSMTSVLWFKGFSFDESKGTVIVKNLRLKSINPPFSMVHRGINEHKWYAGLSITDKNKAIIENVVVENVYGQGIYVANTKQEGIPLAARFDYLQIKNCKVLNCWGFNPQLDDYGDGIYVSNVASALIKNNTITNDFNTTKQFGRSGIVVEYMAENCILSNNKIFGYDRGIHIELDYGGHLISKNRISGTDLALTIYDVPIERHNKPVKIISNNFSNIGLPKNSNLERTRGANSCCDRSLIDIVAKDSCRSGSVVKKNTFLIDGQFDYYSNSIANIRADGIIFRSNKYTILNHQKLKTDIGFYLYSGADIKGETFINLKKMVQRNASRENKLHFYKRNKTGNTQLIYE